jgi:hypothetical protein
MTIKSLMKTTPDLPSKQSLFSGCLAAIMLATLGPGCMTQSRTPSEAFCLDLSKYYTAQLTDSLNSPTYVKENNLAALPKGRQVFQELPFQVSGVLQLSGKKVQEWGRKEFPEAVKNIEVGRSFAQLHLLHGAGGVYDPDGVTIAKLVLHYADRSVKEIEIKTGVHVRDWWGQADQAITGTNSTLAWTGSNPALKKYSRDKLGALRIYKTTFKNPQPGIAVKSIDYQSTMQNSSPFLIALTVE